MTDYERTTIRESEVVEPTVTDRRPAQSMAVRTTESAYTPAGPSASVTLQRVVIFLFGVLQMALILRVVLLVLVANPDNGVVELVLHFTDPFVEPFRGMFALDRVTADQGSVLDIAAIVALVGWTLVEAVILALLRIFDRRQAVAV
jgi:uncharacterized protein YggT (Ycf19 family)